MSRKFTDGWEIAYQQASTQNQSLWKEQPSEFLPAKIPSLQELSVRNILDAGCGDGRNLLYLAQQGFFCTGLDISPSALEKANRKLHEAKLSACLVAGDLTELPAPFPEEFFDAVVCLDVFGQIPDTRELIKGLRAVLANGGHLLVNLYTLDDGTFGQGTEIAPNTFEYRGTIFKYFTEGDILEMFIGFQIVEMEKMNWEDTPHGDFRPISHTHDSIVVLAKKSMYPLAFFLN